MAATTKGKVASKKPTKKAAGIQLIENGNFPLLALKQIEFAPRPEPGQETEFVFYNPRPEEEVLNPEKLASLLYSIRLEGLMEPPCVRVWSEGKDKTAVIRAQLIAGERRLRSLNRIVDEKLPCVDEKGKKPDSFQKGTVVNWKNRFGTVVLHKDTVVKVLFNDHLNAELGEGEQDCEYADILPTITGDKAFEFIPINPYWNIDDERALRISFSENANSEPLSVKAEIALVERFIAKGHKQAQIASMLSTNITFVSQRASFRTQLPPAAFDKLMDGQMTAHIAVNMLAYASEDRQKYFDYMLAEEQKDTAEKVQRHEAEQIQNEDAAELHLADAKKAEAAGDTVTAAKEQKRAASAEGRASKAKARKDRTEKEAGTIKQGHAQRAAVAAGITPKKAKILVKEQIETLYVKGMAKYVAGGEMDPICGQEIPSDLASIVRRTAQAIVLGQLDPLLVIRDYMVANDKWSLSPETSAEINASATAKPKSKLPSRVLNDDEEEEEREDAVLPDEEDEEEDFAFDEEDDEEDEDLVSHFLSDDD